MVSSAGAGDACSSSPSSLPSYQRAADPMPHASSREARFALSRVPAFLLAAHRWSSRLRWADRRFPLPQAADNHKHRAQRKFSGDFESLIRLKSFGAWATGSPIRSTGTNAQSITAADRRTTPGQSRRAWNASRRPPRAHPARPSRHFMPEDGVWMSNMIQPR